ncbi:uncharacterized protein LOC142523760 [Primulina tabacum]|uniref:uncharacterized protein LOC142523760 n=1 Tax=Primulina tabacum TaxID=48773 RepID=UPI003F5AA674
MDDSDKPPKNETGKKINSLYDLSSNYNPGNVITQVKLRGDENYEEWEGSPELEDWWTVQSMLVSWIRNTIEPDLRSTISHMENVKDLWEDIEERFHIANRPRTQQIKTELNECSYGTVRSNLLATEPLPTLNKGYLALAQEERMKIITPAREERGEVIGLAVQTNTRLKGRGETKDNTMICPKCNRTGHDSTSCFQLIGYPEWWGDRPLGEGRAGGRGRGGQQQQQRTGTGRGRS